MHTPAPATSIPTPRGTWAPLAAAASGTALAGLILVLWNARTVTAVTDRPTNGAEVWLQIGLALGLASIGLAVGSYQAYLQARHEAASEERWRQVFDALPEFAKVLEVSDTILAARAAANGHSGVAHLHRSSRE
jgi:hypothetical protein